MLEIYDLEVAYGSITALHRVNIKVEKGKIITLVGSNGAGKSTTLKAISGLVRIRRGKVLLEGVDITNRPPHRVVGMGITQVPEGRMIFSNLTVLENLQMGAFHRKDKEGLKKDYQYVFSLFPRLNERQKQLGGTLSGGEQQMLAIARGLMANPKLLLLDEPSLGLSPLFVSNIFEIIREINRQGTTILLVEQNVYQSLNIAHRGYVVETGRIVLTGSGRELLANDHVKTAFLGM